MATRRSFMTTALRIIALVLLLAVSPIATSARADTPADPATVLSRVAGDLGFPSPTKVEPKNPGPKSPLRARLTIQLSSGETNLPQWTPDPGAGGSLYGQGKTEAPKGTWALQFISIASSQTPDQDGNYSSHCSTSLVIQVFDSRESAQLKAMLEGIQKAASGAVDVSPDKAVALGETKAIDHTQTERYYQLKDLVWSQADWIFIIEKFSNFDKENGCTFSYDSGPDAMVVAQKLYEAAKALAQPSAQPATPIVPATPTIPAKTLALKIDKGWQGVAADGVSKLKLIAELPQGVTADKAEFKITAPAAAAKSAAGGALSTATVEKGTATATYVAPASIMEPFDLRIEASVTDSNKQSYTGSIKLKVVQPPVILVHGLWSNPSAWDELDQLLKSAKFNYVQRFSYADRNSGDPIEIARSLDALLPMEQDPQDKSVYIPSAKADNILASRYDLVGHSLGGLIIRQWIAQGKDNYLRVRKVVTLGAPHLGSAFATWFRYFETSKTGDDKVNNPPFEVKNHANWKSGSHDWTTSAFDWLKNTVRNFEKPPMDASYFKYGPAVDAITPNSAFLTQLNSDASKAHNDYIDYYFLYGQNPLLPADAETAWKQTLADASSWASNEVMIDTFFGHVTRAKTDGVVAEESARGVAFTLDDGTEVPGLAFKPKKTKGVSANHNNITKIGAPMVSLALSGLMDSLQPTYTYGRLESPAHLHAYDAQGRHVGLDAQGKVELGIPGASFSGPEAVTGAPETIVVPGDAQVSFEVQGYQAGSFGLTVRRSAGDSDRQVSYRNVPIGPGQTASLKPDAGGYADLETPGGKVQPQTIVTRAVEADTSSSGLLTILLLLVLGGGGATLLIRARGRRRVLAPAPATPTSTGGTGYGPPAVQSVPAYSSQTVVRPAAASVPPAPGASTSGGFCPNCGQPVQGSSRFCGGCGNPVAQGPKFCGRCGQALTPGSGFCGSCGASASGG